MNRLALLVPVAAAAAAVAVPTAGAGTFKGIVVERDAARHTIAVASPSGVVRTVRTNRLRAAGTRVSVSAAKLPDLTFRASRVTVLGRAGAARVHGVVLRHLQARTLVSAGGSVLSIRTTARTFASANSMRPGTIVNARVRISRGRALGAAAPPGRPGDRVRGRGHDRVALAAPAHGRARRDDHADRPGGADAALRRSPSATASRRSSPSTARRTRS